MRELKFRAWDKKDKFFIDNGALQFGADGKIYYINAGLEYGEPVLEREDITDEVIVEQYTGLKDKNGKEIYEGDVIGYYSERGVLIGKDEVIWMDDCLCFGTREIERGGPCNGLIEPIGDDGADYISAECEIIGNIHENPELLEEK